MAVMVTSPVSVIVCSHNSIRGILDRTLAALKAQTLPLAETELLIVDNGSDVPLADVEQGGLALCCGDKSLQNARLPSVIRSYERRQSTSGFSIRYARLDCLIG